MTDIVEGCAAAWNRMAMDRELAEASKKLVAQSAEIERLRAALRQIAGMDPWSDGEQGYVDKARAALGGGDE